MLDDEGLVAWYERVRAKGIPPSSVTYRNRRCPDCQLPCLDRVTRSGHALYSDYPVDYDGPHRCPPETAQVRALKEQVAHLERQLALQPQSDPSIRPGAEPSSQSETTRPRDPPYQRATPTWRNRPATSPPDDDRLIGVILDPE